MMLLNSEINGPFFIRQTGTIGQEILDSDCRVICWTMDELAAQVIVRLLTEREGLLE